MLARLLADKEPGQKKNGWTTAGKDEVIRNDDGQTDRQTDPQTQTDRQIRRQTDRQIRRQTDRSADRQTDRFTDPRIRTEPRSHGATDDPRMIHG